MLGRLHPHYGSLWSKGSPGEHNVLRKLEESNRFDGATYEMGDEHEDHRDHDKFHIVLRVAWLESGHLAFCACHDQYCFPHHAN
jgi:hypothetical protein